MKIYKIGNSIAIGENQTAINNVAISFLSNAISITYADGSFPRQKVLFTDILDSAGLPVGSDKETIQAYLNVSIFDTGGLNSEGSPHLLRYEQITQGNTVTSYEGRALAGSLDTSAVWQIKKTVQNTTGQTTTIVGHYPSGSDSFSFVWNDRLTLTYS